MNFLKSIFGGSEENKESSLDWNALNDVSQFEKIRVVVVGKWAK